MRRLKSLQLLYHATVASFLAPVSLFVLMAITYLPIPYTQYHTLVSPIPLVGIYFWAIYRPIVLQITVVFLIGLTNDFIGGALIGLHAFLYLTIFLFARAQRRFLRGQGFSAIWACFAIILLAYHGMTWLAYTTLEGQLPFPALPMILNTVVTMAAYPLIIYLFMKIDRRLQRSESFLV